MKGRVTIAKDDGTASPHTLWESWRIARVFRAYQRVILLEKLIVEQRPEGSLGILVRTDQLAVKYQQRVAWRKEVIESHLLGKLPNPNMKAWRQPDAPTEHDGSGDGYGGGDGSLQHSPTEGEES